MEQNEIILIQHMIKWKITMNCNIMISKNTGNLLSSKHMYNILYRYICIFIMYNNKVMLEYTQTSRETYPQKKICL